MEYRYRPQGVCSTEMIFDVENGIVKHLKVINGCDGNLQGIAKLVEGMPVEEVIKRLKGISCRSKRNFLPRPNGKSIRSLFETINKEKSRVKTYTGFFPYF